MIKSEQALKEFAEKWARLLKSKDPNAKEMFIAHLTALINEHYYPKEFTEWCIKNIEHEPIQYRDRNGKVYLNITDIFKHYEYLKSREK